MTCDGESASQSWTTITGTTEFMASMSVFRLKNTPIAEHDHRLTAADIGSGQASGQHRMLR